VLVPRVPAARVWSRKDGRQVGVVQTGLSDGDHLYTSAFDPETGRLAMVTDRGIALLLAAICVTAAARTKPLRLGKTVC
jgi:hypothetical protein